MVSDKVVGVPVKVVKLGVDIDEGELVEEGVDDNVVESVDIRFADVVEGELVEVLPGVVVVAAAGVVVLGSGQLIGNCAFKSSI